MDGLGSQGRRWAWGELASQLMNCARAPACFHLSGPHSECAPCSQRAVTSALNPSPKRPPPCAGNRLFEFVSRFGFPVESSRGWFSGPTQ